MAEATYSGKFSARIIETPIGGLPHVSKFPADLPVPDPGHHFFSSAGRSCRSSAPFA